MGGSGSGKWYRWDTKNTVGGYRSIDVRDWQRKQLLQPGCYFTWTWSRDGEQVASINVQVANDRAVLSYRCRGSDEDWQSVAYPVLLDRTPCNYGGARAWFLCPEVHCGRRVAILYASGYFVCRHCLNLTYQYRRENAALRAAYKADRMWAKLGDSFPEKPKGMRWRTFERLCAEAEQAENESWGAVAGWMGRREARL